MKILIKETVHFSKVYIIRNQNASLEFTEYRDTKDYIVKRKDSNDYEKNLIVIVNSRTRK